MSVAFRENFNLANLPSEWSSGTIVTDSKESRAKAMLGGGIVYAYKYGALTFVDADPGERAAEIDAIRQQLGIPAQSRTVTEEFLVEVSESVKSKVEYNRLIVDDLTPERRAVIAKIISQSVAMECYEALIEDVKAKIAPLVDRLEETGRITGSHIWEMLTMGLLQESPERLYKTIGYSIAIHTEIIGMLHLLDKPDLMWEDRVMDSLYSELRAVFDLGDRFKALEYKLNTGKETLAILADTIKDARGHRLEWAIVVLICAEIAMSLMSRFNILGW